MHERYGFLYEVLAIAVAVVVPKISLLSIGLICISMNTYGAYLFGSGENLLTLTWLNLAIYLVSIFVLGQELDTNTKEREAGLYER